MEDEALWILATVEKHNEKKGFFMVVDDDAGDDKRRCVCLDGVPHLVCSQTHTCDDNLRMHGARDVCFVCMLGCAPATTIRGMFVCTLRGMCAFCVHIQMLTCFLRLCAYRGHQPRWWIGDDKPCLRRTCGGIKQRKLSEARVFYLAGTCCLRGLYRFRYTHLRPQPCC